MVWFLLILMVGQSLGQMECGEEEMEEMTSNFSHCSQEHKRQYSEEVEGGTVEVELATCKLVTELVVTCGELWGLCHTKDKVEKIKDLQLQSVLDKNRDTELDLEQCPIIKGYRKRQILRGELRCTEEQRERGRDRFQICSHNTSTAVYNEVELLTSPSLLLDSLCHALSSLSTTCFSHLANCLPREDLKEMHRLHMADVVQDRKSVV